MISQKTASIDGFITDRPQLSDAEFELFRRFIMESAGISLSPVKKSLVENRLSKRIRELKQSSFKAYYNLVMSDYSKKEAQKLIDLLTTNETYFFREPQHFDYLREQIIPEMASANNISIWCAASSTGEEPYSLAMTLADTLGVNANWNIIATDINTGVLATAQAGKYTLSEKDAIPEKLLTTYCLKGVRSQEGTILVDKSIRKHVNYGQLNLMTEWGGEYKNFDIIFIRNVMIYFDLQTRKRLVDRLANSLKKGGYLFVSHSETLHNLSSRFKLIKPSIYRRID